MNSDEFVKELSAEELRNIVEGTVGDPIPVLNEFGEETYDENGNLFTTESVLLNPNRYNPKKNIVEEKLTTLFDLNSIIWLPTGLEGDDTDGHIDNIFCPIGDQRYLIAKSNDQTTLNYKSLSEANLILKSVYSGEWKIKYEFDNEGNVIFRVDKKKIN